MQFVEKAIIQRLRAELNALPVGTGDPQVALAVVGISNLIIHNTDELELQPAHVPDSDDKPDPLEGMSESKVDFDNPAPVPSLVAAIEALEAKKNGRAFTVREFNGYKLVRLDGSQPRALDEKYLQARTRMPVVLNNYGKIALSPAALSSLLGRSASFLIRNHHIGRFTETPVFSEGKNHFYTIRSAVDFMIRNNLPFAVNMEMLNKLEQALSNN
jgi:hypothetical protein